VRRERAVKGDPRLLAWAGICMQFPPSEQEVPPDPYSPLHKSSASKLFPQFRGPLCPYFLVPYDFQLLQYSVLHLRVLPVHILKEGLKVAT
jgi:hypothetical protein